MHWFDDWSNTSTIRATLLITDFIRHICVVFESPLMPLTKSPTPFPTAPSTSENRSHWIACHPISINQIHVRTRICEAIIFWMHNKSSLSFAKQWILIFNKGESQCKCLSIRSTSRLVALLILKWFICKGWVEFELSFFLVIFALTNRNFAFIVYWFPMNCFFFHSFCGGILRPWNFSTVEFLFRKNDLFEINLCSRNGLSVKIRNAEKYEWTSQNGQKFHCETIPRL